MFNIITKGQAKAPDSTGSTYQDTNKDHRSSKGELPSINSGRGTPKHKTTENNNIGEHNDNILNKRKQLLAKAALGLPCISTNCSWLDASLHLLLVPFPIFGLGFLLFFFNFLLLCNYNKQLRDGLRQYPVDWVPHVQISRQDNEQCVHPHTATCHVAPDPASLPG
jgi:hypothetical protein